MIYVNTILNIIDNSGGKRGLCLNINRKSFKSKAKIGDFVLVVIKKLKKKNKVEKGSMQKAIIVACKYNFKRFSNQYIKFNKNYIILIGKNDLPLGTRVLKPLSFELKKTKYLKIISSSPLIL